jgi:Ribbon-helix-helix protein, copG family
MKRTNIYLDEGQSAALEQVARTQGISRAELIRQFIDRCLNESGERTWTLIWPRSVTPSV